jgi:hypothetical protein
MVTVYRSRSKGGPVCEGPKGRGLIECGSESCCRGSKSGRRDCEGESVWRADFWCTEGKGSQTMLSPC